MTKTGNDPGYSAWWFVLLGLGLTVFGLTLGVLTWMNIIEITRITPIFAPTTLGIIFIVWGLSYVFRGKRIKQ